MNMDSYPTLVRWQTKRAMKNSIRGESIKCMGRLLQSSQRNIHEPPYRVWWTKNGTTPCGHLSLSLWRCLDLPRAGARVLRQKGPWVWRGGCGMARRDLETAWCRETSYVLVWWTAVQPKASSAYCCCWCCCFCGWYMRDLQSNQYTSMRTETNTMWKHVSRRFSRHEFTGSWLRIHSREMPTTASPPDTPPNWKKETTSFQRAILPPLPDVTQTTTSTNGTPKCRFSWSMPASLACCG